MEPSLQSPLPPGRLPLEHYQLLVEHAPSMVWRAGVSGECDYFNATWLQFTGRSLAEELGSGWGGGVHPEDRPACLAIYEEHLRKQQPFEMECRLRRQDGVYRYILNRGVPFFDGEGRFAGYIGSCVDVHERHQLDKDKAAFLSLVAHELRTPITSMKAYLEVMRRRLQGCEPLLLGLVERMHAPLDKFTALVRELEDSGRMEEGGRLVLRREVVDVAEIVREVVSQQRTSSTLSRDSQRSPDLELAVGPGDFKLCVDPKRLERVASNLLGNAVKYSPRGGTVRVVLEREDRQVRMRVADEGIGIPASDIPFLTRRYFRASNTSHENFPGLGLGLAITKEIVEGHGGKLYIDSELGKGTTVTITLATLEAGPA